MVYFQMHKRFESFTCIHCGHTVKPLPNGTRDHCPLCLYSQHVDHEPGDRANESEGLLEPIEVTKKSGEIKIIYRCQSCKARVVNRLAPDDNPDALVLISLESIH